MINVTTRSQAEAITGGLTTTSKMPSKSHGIDAFMCQTGGKLAKIKGSTCFNCYARKGFYVMPTVHRAFDRRYRLAPTRYIDTQGLWIEAMVYLIQNEYTKHGTTVFRWHDSGDLHGLEHLLNIIQVVEQTPHVKHWLPTREYGFISEYKTYLKRHGKRTPENLSIRLSAHMIDQTPDKIELLTDTDNNINTSTVVTKPATHDKEVALLGLQILHGFLCPSSKQDGKCKDCRACWNTEIKNIAYIKH
tara:strand:+ start:2790 stop:3530 length:741 start_codon:yes stop_codon:yes gene_type:complete